LPSNQIKHTAYETFEGLKALSFYLMNFLPSENNLTNSSDTRYYYPIKKHRQRLENQSMIICQTNFIYIFVSFFFFFF
jgi:hypothetical protein